MGTYMQSLSTGVKLSVLLFILIQLNTCAARDPSKNEALASEKSVTKGPVKDAAAGNHRKEQPQDIDLIPPPLPNSPEFLAQLQPLMNQLKEKKPDIWEKIQRIMHLPTWLQTKRTVAHFWNKYGWGKKAKQPPAATPAPSKPVGLQQVGSLSVAPQKVKRPVSGGQFLTPINQKITSVGQPLTPINQKIAPVAQPLSGVDQRIAPVGQQHAPIDQVIAPVGHPQGHLDKPSVKIQKPSPTPGVKEERPQEPSVQSPQHPELVEEVHARRGEVAPPGKQEEQTHRQEEAPPQQQQQPAPAPAVDSQVAQPVQPSQHQTPVHEPQTLGIQTPDAATLRPMRLDYVGWARRIKENRLPISSCAPPPLASYTPPPPSHPDSYIYGYPRPNYNYYYNEKKRTDDYNEFMKRLLDVPERMF